MLLMATAMASFVILIHTLLFFVAVPEENRVVHGYSQLQDSGQCFGQVRDLSEEIVGTHI